jgi:polyhydroxyalkanoate synthesis regulator phasin
LTAVSDRGASDQQGGLSEALRNAVERTFAATAGSAAETRERAGDLLDDVARRGTEARGAVEDARRAVVRRGQEAGERPRALASRLLDAIRGAREGDEVEALRAEVSRLRRRIAELEQGSRARALVDRAKSKPKPKG